MTLQNLCIDIIISNFEQYFSKFSNTEDASLKRRFEFLQRKYSYLMASSLSQEGRLETEYIDFLINKHLKQLNFDWLRGCSWDKIVAKFKEVGPGLQKLHLRWYEDCGMPLQDLMRHLPNLQVVQFHKNCTNDILKSLAQFCENILEIEIYCSPDVTSEGIKHLCTKEDGESTGLKLRRLSVDHCCDVKEGIAYLMEHMPSVEMLDYFWLMDVFYSMHRNDLKRIGKMQPYNLQKLDFRCKAGNWSELSKFLKICSSLCPRVKYLRYELYSKKDRKFICRFRDLQYLYLQQPIRSIIDVSKLLKLIGKQLLFLAVESESISAVTLANSCPLLKEMDLLWHVNLKIRGVHSPLFPALEKCTFRGFGEEYAETVRRVFRFSPKLEDVTFWHCTFHLSSPLTAETLKCVTKSMKKMTFVGPVEVTFLQDILLNCHSLRSLTLACSVFDDDKKFELKNVAQSLHNRPKVVFMDQNCCDVADCERSNPF